MESSSSTSLSISYNHHQNRSSRIRRRPVSFGNPALGTYNGFLYTMEETTGEQNRNNDWKNYRQHIFVEEAHSTDRIVAMTDVPPEQVPEGILNLARPYQPYIHHIRIVIEETQIEVQKENDSEHEQPGYGIHNKRYEENFNKHSSIGTNNSSTLFIETGGGDHHRHRHHHQSMDVDTLTTADITESMIEKLLLDENEEDTKQHQHQNQQRELLQNLQQHSKQQIQYNKNSFGNMRPPPRFVHPSASASAVESAASILAADDFRGNDNRDKNTIIYNNNNNNNSNNNSNISLDDDRGRTYLILFDLCSEEAADMLVEDLHGKPYTSLDETETCSMYHVIAMKGENGVSLLSPFFAPSVDSSSPTAAATAASSKNQVATKLKTIKTTKTNSSSGNINPSHSQQLSTNSSSAARSSPKTSTSNTSTNNEENYNCAVCLEHMNLDHQLNENDEVITSILTTVCNHSFHMDCLLQWQDSPCPVCRYDHSGLNEALSTCHVCGTTENNFVCLICGVISCAGVRNNNTTNNTIAAAAAAATTHHTGDDDVDALNTALAGASNDKSSNNTSTTTSSIAASHARKHYDETLHAYALDTETQHVWDFAGQGYVHRLLQNKEDGKLVEFHDPSNTTSHERSLNPGLSDIQEGEVVHRKLEGFASQYYTLLKSQLEQQRTYYEGRLEELRRECRSQRRKSVVDFVNALRQEKNQLSKRVASLKGKHKKVREELAFLKNLNESLEANKTPLKRKVQEAQRQRIEMKDMLQQRLPMLENQVSMLMLQLEESPALDETTKTATARSDTIAVAAAKITHNYNDNCIHDYNHNASGSTSNPCNNNQNETATDVCVPAVAGVQRITNNKKKHVRQQHNRRHHHLHHHQQQQEKGRINSVDDRKPAAKKK